MQAYSDPDRATDPWSLPDVEVFFIGRSDVTPDSVFWPEDETDLDPDEDIDRYSDIQLEFEGWYWWSCFPGCLPDSEPFGPFETEAEALADAQDIDGFDDPDTPGEDDIIVTDHGPLGGLSIAHFSGREIAGPCPDDEIDDLIRAWCDENHYWPDVWTISDHGNPIRRSIH